MIRSIEHVYRHDHGRKLDRFEDCDKDAAGIICAEDAALLGVYEADLLDVTNPFSMLPKPPFPMVFILQFNNANYLVNTEGYDYCRYVRPCIIV